MSQPPNIFLDPTSDAPVYLQISQAVAHEIRRGRFKPGDPLPGYRTLAEQLGVSRNTVMAAYRELQAEGWVVSTPGEGSVVAPAPPDRATAGAEPAPTSETIGFDLAGAAPRLSQPSPGNLLHVASGIPDPRLIPGAELARAYRRALTSRPQAALTVEDPQGHPALREALARLLSGARGMAASANRVLVARSVQMAWFLTARALIRPGDAVAVEALGARGAWEALAGAGARCLPLPVDRDGLDVEALARLLSTRPLRAVLVAPRRHYPTLVALSAPRRARLLELARARRFAVLEADLDAEFQFEGRSAAPLAADDPAGVVIHVGALSKIFAAGMRLGFVHGPAPLVARLREARAVLDQQGDPVLERAMAEMLEDGEIERHLNRMHQVYRRRRDALVAALRRELGEAAAVATPEGGLALWVEARPGVDVDAWAARALEGGVAVQPGRQFAFDGTAVAGFRIGFANYAEPELLEVARRLRAALECAA
jgi:GntR family transcriptional regulator/MocR family aminotransferase